MKIGVVVQARFQSTRLPGKVLLDFYNGKTMLELIVDNLIANTNLPVVVATSVEKADDKIVELCENKRYLIYRGSENDVLDRFIGAAEKFGFTHIIRVCSDNPFMLPNEVKSLANEAVKNPDKDYISFKINETPSILTHYGLWAELAKVKALQTSANIDKNVYHEHVTYFIYKNPEIFDCLWLDVNSEIANIKNLRLTVDEKEDFINTQNIMKAIGSNFNEASIISYIKENPVLLSSMEILIRKHSKS